MKYAQLSKDAKERARQWWKDLEAQEWGQMRAPDLYEDMAECLKFLGITVSQTTRPGGRYLDPKDPRGRAITEWDFEWSGFWSQGDGLVFKGEWNAKDVSLSGLKGYAPQDKVLERICVMAMALMLRWPEATADITTVSYGPGLPAMHTEDEFTGLDMAGMNDDPQLPGEDIATLRQIIADAAHWCYKQLEDNYESDTGDEAAEEGIEANDYDFDKDGGIRVRRRA